MCQCDRPTCRDFRLDRWPLESLWLVAIAFGVLKLHLATSTTINTSKELTSNMTNHNAQLVYSAPYAVICTNEDEEELVRLCNCGHVEHGETGGIKHKETEEVQQPDE